MINILKISFSHAPISKHFGILILCKDQPPLLLLARLKVYGYITICNQKRTKSLYLTKCVLHTIIIPKTTQPTWIQSCVKTKRGTLVNSSIRVAYNTGIQSHISFCDIVNS